MSHHLDTPEAARSGQLFLDDLYVFPGTDSTVFVMDVNSDITGSRAEPGFHPEGRYEFKIHRDGRAIEQLTYRLAFGEADGSGAQPWRLSVLRGDDAHDDAAAGELLLEGRTGATATGDGVRVWAGRIKDSFYIDLSLLAVVNSAVAKGSAPDFSAWRPGSAANSFDGTTVETIVLEVAHSSSGLRPGETIGLWATTKLATDAGGWRQINRAGHPMMWPIFWPGDTDFSNPANTRHPEDDAAADGSYIAEHVAGVVAALGTAEDAAGYGRAVADELFPDVLTYVVGSAASYGFARRNGRTLADNAPEVMLSLVTNTAIDSGLTPATSAALRRPDFPYVVPV